VTIDSLAFRRRFPKEGHPRHEYPPGGQIKQIKEM